MKSVDSACGYTVAISEPADGARIYEFLKEYTKLNSDGTLNRKLNLAKQVKHYVDDALCVVLLHCDNIVGIAFLNKDEVSTTINRYVVDSEHRDGCGEYLFANTLVNELIEDDNIELVPGWIQTNIFNGALIDMTKFGGPYLFRLDYRDVFKKIREEL